MGNTTSEIRTQTTLLPISTISMPKFFSKINPKDYKILKYVPDELLRGEQLAVKTSMSEEGEQNKRPPCGDLFFLKTNPNFDTNVPPFEARGCKDILGGANHFTMHR